MKGKDKFDALAQKITQRRTSLAAYSILFVFAILFQKALCKIALDKLALTWLKWE
jgi:hypothetical protein